MDHGRRPRDPSGDPDLLRRLGFFRGRGGGERPPVTWLSLILWSGLAVLLFFVLSGGF